MVRYSDSSHSVLSCFLLCAQPYHLNKENDPIKGQPCGSHSSVAALISSLSSNEEQIPVPAKSCQMEPSCDNYRFIDLSIHPHSLKNKRETNLNSQRSADDITRSCALYFSAHHLCGSHTSVADRVFFDCSHQFFHQKSLIPYHPLKQRVTNFFYVLYCVFFFI